jgi:hypothetical protein
MSGAQSTIILSYRREDSAGVTGRIFDRLAQEFGTDRVFMDIDSMPAGVDFQDHLQEILADCGALLVVIGKSWRSSARGSRRGSWTRTTGSGSRSKPHSSAQYPSFPLLIDGATLPARDQLPESLWPLLRRNALPVDSGRDFHAQLTRLVRDLHLQVDPTGAKTNPAPANTTLQAITAMPASGVNWKRWAGGSSSSP